MLRAFFFFFWWGYLTFGIPGGSVVKESACQCWRHRRYGFNSWNQKICWSRRWQSTPVSLPQNPMDRGVWWATVHRVTKSRTGLSTQVQAGDNIQPCCTPFPVLNQSIVPCPVLTVGFWPAYRFIRKQIMWSGIPISLRNFHSLLWPTESKVMEFQLSKWKL